MLRTHMFDCFTVSAIGAAIFLAMTITISTITSRQPRQMRTTTARVLLL